VQSGWEGTKQTTLVEVSEVFIAQLVNPD
jgi:hypothetical protein